MAALFWVNGTGTWDGVDTTHWDTSSGGPGGAGPPGAGDTVTFDASSGGGTVTVTTNPNVTSITGGAHTGTVDFTSRTITAVSMSWSGSGVRVLTITNANITLSLGGTAWNCASFSNFTLNASGSTITCNGAAASFNGGSRVYGTVLMSGSGIAVLGGGGTPTYNTVTRSGGDFTINDSENITTLNYTGEAAGRAFKVVSGKTLTVTTFNVNGSASKLITITAVTGGSAFTVSKSSGTVSCDYLSIKDSTATGGATFYAGANSTSVSGNSGWIFTAVPTVGGNITAYSSQQALNSIYGSTEYQYTLQNIANLYNSTPINSLTFQEVLNSRAGRGQHAMSEQEALYTNVKTALSLTGPATQYSVQELLNLCKGNGVSTATIFG